MGPFQQQDPALQLMALGNAAQPRAAQARSESGVLSESQGFQGLLLRPATQPESETSLCNRQEELPAYKSQLVFESGTEGKLWINEFELRNKQSVHKDDLPLGAGTLRFPAVSLTSCQKRLKCQSFVRNSEVRT